AAPPPGPAGADGGAPAVPSATVKIMFQTVPPEKAVVMWGKKPLGYIKGPKRPLTIERPRDSGPIDVVVRSDGYIPVHTRAYTFSDAKVFVKLTPIEEKKTLFGYREELPDAGPPDGGPPPPMMGPPGPPSAAPDGGAPGR